MEITTQEELMLVLIQHHVVHQEVLIQQEVLLQLVEVEVLIHQEEV